MIRFSAFLVAGAVGLLVAGVVTSRLLLVYIAIGVSAVALLALGAGTALHRGELFAGPETAGPADAASAQPEARAPAGIPHPPSLPPSFPPEQEAQRLPESAASALSQHGPLNWASQSAPVPRRDAPGDRPAPEPSVSVPASAPEPAWPPRAAPPGPVPAAETSVDLPPVPAAETRGAAPEARDITEPPAASEASETGAPPEEQRKVTVVPGVPRYHDAHCILIRFMSEDDLEKTTLAAARDAGCTPCRACQPDQREGPDQPEPGRHDTAATTR